MLREQGKPGTAEEATQRLFKTARRIDGSSKLFRPEPAADDMLLGFATAYTDWIVSYYGTPGVVAERMEKIRLLLHALVSADNLRHALSLIVRFERLIWGEHGLCSLREDEQGATLVLERPFVDGPAGFIAESWALSLHLSLLEFLVGDQLRGTTASVRGPACVPLDLEALLFSCPRQYEAGACSLFIPRRHLDRVISCREEAIADFPNRLVLRTLGVESNGVAFSTLIGRLLRTVSFDEFGAAATLNSVADKLGYSPATLRRRLAAEKVGFREIKGIVFDELAENWLREGRVVDDIAELLGYSEASSFRRRFRRRHGCTPTAFRRAGSAARRVQGGVQ